MFDINNFEIQNMDKVVLANNKEMAKIKKDRMVSVPSIDRLTGEIQYELNYCKETWEIVRTQNNNNVRYTLELKLTSHHGRGRTITLKVRLNDEQVEYMINKLGALRNGQRINLKTRFVYGLTKRGEPYVNYRFLMGDKYPTGNFMSPMQLEVFLENMNEMESAYDVVLEKKTPNDTIDEALDFDEVEENSNKEVVDID